MAVHCGIEVNVKVAMVVEVAVDVEVARVDVAVEVARVDVAVAVEELEMEVTMMERGQPRMLQ